MSQLITLGLYALATARLVRLVGEDKITEKLRARLLRGASKTSMRRYLIECTWCLSIWCAAPFAAAYVLVPDHPAALIPAVLLAYSWLAVIAYDLQRLLKGKANLYQMPMPAPETVEEQEATR
jgi:uncharacterized protein DUF1360